MVSAADRGGCIRRRSPPILARVLLLVFWSLLLLPVRPAGADVRISAHDGTTRFVVDLPKKVGFRYRTETDPDRLVIDIDDVTLETQAQIRKAAGAIRNYRFETPSSGRLRLVIDLARPVAVGKAFMLGPERG
ncbi:MAG: AMIN domain-containing protein, partial [Alphaproteobacteria bacterium]